MNEEKRKPTKLSQLKQERRFLRGQIRKAKATLRLRDQVTGMRAQLSDMQEEIEHPERFLHKRSSTLRDSSTLWTTERPWPAFRKRGGPEALRGRLGMGRAISKS